MTESPMGGAHRGESRLFSASGLLGTNALQRSVDTFDHSVEALSQVVKQLGQAAQQYQRGSTTAGSWNQMSNWAGSSNGGNATFGGKPASGSGGSGQPPANAGAATQPGAHRASGPASFFGGSPGTHRGSGNGFGKTMYAMGVASKMYQNTFQSFADAGNDSQLYLQTAYQANFGQANSIAAQGALGQRMFNYTGWANNGADAAQAMNTIASQAGGLMTSAAGQQLQGFVKNAAYVTPSMSGAQAAGVVTGFYQPKAYVGLRTVGVQTMRPNGSRQSPTEIANQVLNQVDPTQSVRSPQDAAQLITDPMSPLNLTLGNWVSNGIISGDQVTEIKQQIQAILKARQQGISAGQLSHALNTRDTSSKSRALLQHAGLDSVLQREKDLQASKRQPTVDRLQGFAQGVADATKNLADFTNTLRDATSGQSGFTGWVSKKTGQIAGELQHPVGGLIAELGGLIGYGWMWGKGAGSGSGGSNETRMSVGGGLTGVTVSPQPHNAMAASMGGAMAGGPANTAPHSSRSSTGSGGSGSHAGGGSGRQRMILPVRGYKLGVGFGVAGPMWSSGHHTGQDIECPTGTPVHAPADGHVIFAGYDGPYGNLVQISHGHGVVSFMAHNSRLVVHVGADVRQGQLIAYSGATGNVTGPHCHFEVRVNGTPVNPMLYVNGGRTVSGSGGGKGTSGSGTNAANGSGTSYNGSDQTAAFYSSPGISGVGTSELDLFSGAGSVGAAGTASMGTSGSMGASPTGTTPGGGITPVPGGGSSAQNVALGKKLAAKYGWGNGAEWKALYQLWMRESGWRTNADNPTSSAYGIAQAMIGQHKLPKGYYDHYTGSGGSIQAFGGDPSVQIQWGLQYIKGKYGDPVKAWAHETGIGWYDKGAWKLPGDEIAQVHKGEMIIPAKEADQIREVLINGNPYGVMGNQAKGSGVVLQFNQGSVVVHVESTGEPHADGVAIGKGFIDALNQNDRINALMNGSRT